MKILPRELRCGVRPEEVATTHKTVLDMSPHQAVTSFISLLRNWQLFGATIFEVSVCLSMLQLSIRYIMFFLLDGVCYKHWARVHKGRWVLCCIENWLHPQVPQDWRSVSRLTCFSKSLGAMTCVVADSDSRGRKHSKYLISNQFSIFSFN